jgi:hypothetical protein
MRVVWSDENIFDMLFFVDIQITKTIIVFLQINSRVSKRNHFLGLCIIVISLALSLKLILTLTLILSFSLSLSFSHSQSHFSCLKYDNFVPKFLYSHYSILNRYIWKQNKILSHVPLLICHSKFESSIHKFTPLMLFENFESITNVPKFNKFLTENNKSEGNNNQIRT